MSPWGNHIPSWRKASAKALRAWQVQITHRGHGGWTRWRREVVGDEIKGEVVASSGGLPVWTLTVTLSETVDLFSREVVSGYHSLVTWHNRSLSSRNGGGQKSEIKALVTLVSSGVSEGEPVPCLSPSSWWLKTVFGISWLIDLSPQSLPPFSRGLLPCVSLSVFSLSVSSKDTGHWIESPPNLSLGWSLARSSIWSHLQRSYFHIRKCQGLGLRYIFWEDTIQPRTDGQLLEVFEHKSEKIWYELKGSIWLPCGYA